MSLKNIGIVLFVCALAIVIGAIAYFVYLFQYRNPFLEVELAKNLRISSEWTEIDTKNLIKFEKEYHYVSILIKPPILIPKDENGIKLPDGRVVSPELVLRDSEQNEYQLTYIGARFASDGDYANYGYNGGKTSLPSERIYIELRIRCEIPIEIGKIVWTGYNQSDRK